MINYILIKRVIKRLYSQLLGKHLNKIKNGQGERPYYAYCIQKAAQLGSNLGHEKMTIIELGVAGGAGLLSIEKTCELIRKYINIDFEVYGFDLGSGLPGPVDYRDEPYKWAEGFYKMDREKLESKLTFSKLIIGDVEETLKKFFINYNPSPIGCIIFDLDLYSSTKSAMKIFESATKYFLPRVMCYFDDIGSIEFVGERLAINEFNNENDTKKIGQNHKIKFNRKLRGNYIFEYHDFKHPDYNKKCELKSVKELPIA